MERDMKTKTDIRRTRPSNQFEKEEEKRKTATQTQEMNFGLHSVLYFLASVMGYIHSFFFPFYNSLQLGCQCLQCACTATE